MGNSLKKLCNSIKIRSTCVSTCCSDNTKQEVILTPIQIPPQHAHHIEHHESIQNIGGGIILHIVTDTICGGSASANAIEDKIVCD